MRGGRSTFATVRGKGGPLTMQEPGANRPKSEPLDARLEAVEQRLAAVQEALAAVQTTQQRLVEQTGKVENELRRARWWRWFWLVIRLLVVLVIAGVLAYFFVDWRDVLQFFV
jgi:hypothetical protein